MSNTGKKLNGDHQTLKFYPFGPFDNLPVSASRESVDSRLNCLLNLKDLESYLATTNSSLQHLIQSTSCSELLQFIIKETTRQNDSSDKSYINSKFHVKGNFDKFIRSYLSHRFMPYIRNSISLNSPSTVDKNINLTTNNQTQNNYHIQLRNKGLQEMDKNVGYSQFTFLTKRIYYS